MKISKEKSLMLLSGNDIASANIDNSTIIHGNKNEILGIFLDSKFSLKDQINIC